MSEALNVRTSACREFLQSKVMHVSFFTSCPHKNCKGEKVTSESTASYNNMSIQYVTGPGHIPMTTIVAVAAVVVAAGPFCCCLPTSPLHCLLLSRPQDFRAVPSVSSACRAEGLRGDDAPSYVATLSPPDHSRLLNLVTGRGAPRHYLPNSATEDG